MGNSIGFASRKFFFGSSVCLTLVFFEVPPRKFSGANFGINFRERTLGFFLPHFFGGTIACQYSVGFRLSVQCRRLVFSRGWFRVSAASFSFCPSPSFFFFFFFFFFWGRPGFPSFGLGCACANSGLPDSRSYTTERLMSMQPLFPPSLPLAWVGSFSFRSLSLSFSLSSFSCIRHCEVTQEM